MRYFSQVRGALSRSSLGQLWQRATQSTLHESRLPLLGQHGLLRSGLHDRGFSSIGTSHGSGLRRASGLIKPQPSEIAAISGVNNHQLRIQQSLKGLSGTENPSTWGAAVSMPPSGNRVDSKPVKIGYYEILNTQGHLVSDGQNAVFMQHEGSFEWLDESKCSGDKFFVFSYFDRQYKVSEQDVVYTEKVNASVNDEVTFGTVLLIGTKDWTVLGRPYILNAKVLARVEEHGKTKKTLKIVTKKRKGYRRKVGHRHDVSRLRILSLQFETPSAEQLRQIPLIFSRGIPIMSPKASK
eukprot:CAMPEP_0184694846 /NCGR_PEP_ID=MMETSP0313-20130426/2682_1 /TAXON_ID=2792 /ORGANISM="Porphyridium aerugineum, Strain SAG 1380-2" /LENGTH=295 /DNA_ID=CAMNT_0027153205 /DNA_START=46 /DNA_END=933 /DNA_ORIENTATION=+